MHVGAGDDVKLRAAVRAVGADAVLALGGIHWGPGLRAQGGRVRQGHLPHLPPACRTAGPAQRPPGLTHTTEAPERVRTPPGTLPNLRASPEPPPLGPGLTWYSAFP